MRKTSSQGKICTYCDNPATPQSDPPMCEQCQCLYKQASQADTEQQPSSKSLKELLQ